MTFSVLHMAISNYILSFPQEVESLCEETEQMETNYIIIEF